MDSQSTYERAYRERFLSRQREARAKKAKARLPSTKQLLELLRMYRRVLPWSFRKAMSELEARGSPEDWKIFLSLFKARVKKIQAALARLEDLRDEKMRNLVGE